MNSVFNAGATLLPDGSTLLLCRVEDRRGLSHLCVARSANGVDGWQIDREPTFIPDVERFPRVMGRRRSAHHVYAGTPAICRGLYFVFAWRSRSVSGTHERFSRIRETRCRHVAGRQRRGPFARRINGSWALIHRPMTPLGAHIWISYSPICGIGAITSSCWSPRGLGGCQQNWNVTAPIETSRGWLMIYHGVRRTPSSSIYRLGLALFDLEQPEKCLIRGILGCLRLKRNMNVMATSKTWCFLAAIRWDRMGHHQSLLRCADSSIALAHGSIRSLLAWLDANGHSEQAHDRRQRQR